MFGRWRLRAALVCAAVLLSSALLGPLAAAAPSDMADRLLSAPLPGRDPLDLAVRFRGVSPSTPMVATTPAPALTAGAQQTFSVLDQRSATYSDIHATLHVVTPHAYWFVEDDLAQQTSDPALQASAGVFEHRTYPLVHQYFGSEQAPSVDGDPHLVFLLANVPSVAAYFASADAYPRAVNPRSNQHKMIYVNLNALRPGNDSFDSTVTHEFQHMVHFASCPTQEGWLDEGASELATHIAGYTGNPPQAFALHPDVQLNAWSPQTADVLRHYQAAYLFLRYVAERAGGWDALPRIFSSCERGEAQFAAFLKLQLQPQQQPIAPDLDSLFSDWTVANVLQDANVADGQYAYDNAQFRVSETGTLTPDTSFLGEVPQFAANYVELPTGPGAITFQGDPSVPLTDAARASDSNLNGIWWSNRGDNLDSRLTRTIDLSGVSEAHASFRVWYDLENQFDFAYLSVSRDGGQTWQTLPGHHTVPDTQTGNNYGPGWTGSSGGWLDEQVDLSPFVGGRVLLRFEYVTDQSYNAQGFAFSDVSIPELGVQEPGAADGVWDADGFVRVDGPIPEHWNLRVIRWADDGIHVEPVSVDAGGSATFALDPNASRSLLVVAPTAPRTLVPADYSVSLA